MTHYRITFEKMNDLDPWEVDKKVVIKCQSYIFDRLESDLTDWVKEEIDSTATVEETDSQ